jgi:hypothetical protein
MLKFLFLVLLLLLPIQALGTAYYVSTSGDDANNGTTSAAPWKSIFKLNRTSFAPGDFILFKRGDVWIGADAAPIIPATSGSAGSPITWGAYGTGSNPVLTAATSRNSSSDWTDEGGNIWSTGGVTLAGGELFPNPVFGVDTTGWYGGCSGDGANCVSGRTSSDGGAGAPPAAYTFTMADHGLVPADVQLYTAYSASPGFTQGKYYSLTFRAKSSIPFTVIPALILKSQDEGNADITSGMIVQDLQVGTEWTMCTAIFRSDRTITKGGFNLLLGGSTGIPNGATFSVGGFSCREIADQDFFGMYHSANLIFNFSSGAPVAGKLVQSGTLANQGEWNQSYLDRKIRLYSTSNPAEYYQGDIIIVNGAPKSGFWIGGRSYHTVQNLDFFAMPSAWYGFDFTDNTIEHCAAYYTGGDLQVDVRDYNWGGGSVIVRKGESVGATGNITNWIVRYNDFRQAYDCTVTWQNNGSGRADGIWVYYNILGLAHYNIEFWWTGAGSSMSNVHVYNNVMYDAGGEWSANQRPDEPVPTVDAHISFSPVNGSNINIKNNIMVGGISQMLLLGAWSDWSSVLAMNHNLYYGQTSRFARASGTRFAMFENWQAASGQDAASLWTDPLMVSRDKHDFRLLLGSPARAAGADVGLGFDFAGNPVHGSAPDIGAYQQVPAPLSFSIADSASSFGTPAVVGAVTLNGVNGTDQVTALVTVFNGAGNPVTLDGSTPAGSYTVMVTGLAGAQAAGYQVAAGGNRDGKLTVNPASQSITFNDLAARTLGDAPFNLVASSTSGLPVSFASSDPEVALINGSTVTIAGAGSATISASQGGNSNYAAAAGVARTLTVHPSPHLIPGDLNGDGKVDIADALLALRIAVGIDTALPAKFAAGDVAPLVNGKAAPNGVIDVGDVVVILRIAIGLLSL